MSPAEIHELYYTILEAMDRDYEFWMTASFAVVVASYFIAERMSQYLFVLLLAGYSLFSVGMFYRWLVLAQRIAEVRVMPVGTGYEIDTTSSVYAGTITIITWLFGVVGTIGYVVYSYRSKGGT